MSCGSVRTMPAGVAVAAAVVVLAAAAAELTRRALARELKTRQMGQG